LIKYCFLALEVYEELSCMSINYYLNYHDRVCSGLSGATPVEDDPMVTFSLFRLQEPEAPFQNATSRDWQKAFNPQRELGGSAAGQRRFVAYFIHFLFHERTDSYLAGI
jgi:hypothetical protein